MTNSKMRIFTCLLAVMLCFTAFSVPVYAGGGPDEEEEAVEVTGGVEPETDPQALTPEGNMTLVDDIEGDTAEDKQFITVVTRGGNYFYIIVDRAGEGENTVHFLNQVDEVDLLSLMDEEEIAALGGTASCVCTDKCTAGAVNADCPVCSVNMTECTGAEAPIAGDDAVDADAETEPEPEQKSGGSGILVVILLLAIAGGGAFYYFKILGNKPKTKGSDDLDDYDYGEDLDGEDDMPDEDDYDAVPDEAEDVSDSIASVEDADK